MADLVFWPRASFGIKPRVVMKSGFIVWATCGDANGSMMDSEPNIQRPMWGSLGLSPQKLGATFVSKLAIEAGRAEKLGVQKPFLPIANTNGLGKKDMLHNDALPNIEVDSETFEVRADGRLLAGPPAAQVPLNRAYMLR